MNHDLVRRIRTYAEGRGVRWSGIAVCAVCGEDAFWDGESERCVHPSCEPEPEPEEF